MTGGDLVREARKRAGLTQRDLARTLGTTQAVIARWETERQSPSFERVVAAIRACGFDLGVRIVAPDDQHALLIEDALRLTPRQRLDRAARRNAGLRRLTEAARRS